MRARSLKMQRIYRERRKLVTELLAMWPYCQRCASARSTEVHEVLSRGRGGSILDRANCVTLCHACHSWITTHPREATREGWLKSAWQT